MSIVCVCSISAFCAVCAPSVACAISTVRSVSIAGVGVGCSGDGNPAAVGMSVDLVCVASPLALCLTVSVLPPGMEVVLAAVVTLVELVVLLLAAVAVATSLALVFALTFVPALAFLLVL